MSQHNYMSLAQSQLREAEMEVMSYDYALRNCSNGVRYQRLWKEQQLVIQNVKEMRDLLTAQPRKKGGINTDMIDSQIALFNAAKAKRSEVMRDFTDIKTHFVGHDNRVIAMAEYQQLTRLIKSGVDPSTLMRGETLVFTTGYVKKTNSYTTTSVFIPLSHPYASTFKR